MYSTGRPLQGESLKDGRGSGEKKGYPEVTRPVWVSKVSREKNHHYGVKRRWSNRCSRRCKESYAEEGVLGRQSKGKKRKGKGNSPLGGSVKSEGKQTKNMV